MGEREWETFNQEEDTSHLTYIPYGLHLDLPREHCIMPSAGLASQCTVFRIRL